MGENAPVFKARTRALRLPALRECGGEIITPPRPSPSPPTASSAHVVDEITCFVDRSPQKRARHRIVDAHLRLEDAREGAGIVATGYALAARDALTSTDTIWDGSNRSLLATAAAAEARRLREIADRNRFEEDRHDLRLAVEQANIEPCGPGR